MASKAAMPPPRNGPVATIPLRRLVAGAFLHFGVVAYLVVVPVLCLLLAPERAGAAQWLALGIRVSGLFLAGLAATATVAILLAAGIDARADRRSRRAESADAAVSRRRTAAAVETARDVLDADHATMIAGHAWHHEDPRYQALSRDLARVVETAAAALDGATPERAVVVRERAAESLHHIDRALAELAAERAALADDDARAAALYVRRRYGVSDFATKPD